MNKDRIIIETRGGMVLVTYAVWCLILIVVMGIVFLAKEFLVG